VYEYVKNIFGGNIYVCSKVSCLRLSINLFVCTHVLSLEKTLPATLPVNNVPFPFDILLVCIGPLVYGL